jgi:hypothetical protein
MSDSSVIISSDVFQISTTKATPIPPLVNLAAPVFESVHIPTTELRTLSQLKPAPPEFSLIDCPDTSRVTFNPPAHELLTAFLANLSDYTLINLPTAMIKEDVMLSRPVHLVENHIKSSQQDNCRFQLLITTVNVLKPVS